MYAHPCQILAHMQVAQHSRPPLPDRERPRGGGYDDRRDRDYDRRGSDRDYDRRDRDYDRRDGALAPSSMRI